MPSAKLLGAVVLALLLPHAAQASLPAVGSGSRPGPEALYAAPPAAPQLENAEPYAAPPILVSGGAAYRDGEFLYQDHLFDDRGARSVRDPSDPVSPSDFMFSPRAGTLTYPTDPVFANNAADLVELRVKPIRGATALRVTLNTMHDPERVAFTVALGESGEPREWPHRAGVRSPAALFLTVHGETAELRDAATGRPLQPGATASVDRRRRQVDVRIPHASYDPGGDVVAMRAGVGLWDRAAGTYLQPQPVASATAPGGGLAGGAALFNMAFRFDEPLPDVNRHGVPVTIADSALLAPASARFWREERQAELLASGDVTRFVARVDFAKLAAKADDDHAVPKTGPITRIFASRHEAGQGVDYGKLCGGIEAAGGGPLKCDGAFVGRLQPYALYVPSKPLPRRGYGLTLLLHSLSANHNQYTDSNNQRQLGERGAGSLVATPLGRGPDGFYQDIAEADTFEVWADVARHYRVDPDWVAISGYSMGGIGTFRLATRWPDLFARAFSVVGDGSPNATLPSLRNVPLLSWAALADELVNVASTEETFQDMVAAGLRVEHDLFELADHLSLATNDEYGVGAAFLGEHRVDRDPAHVTYVVAPATDSERARAVADHAYWLSGLRVRSRDAGDGRGTIDVRSAGFGTGDPPVLPLRTEQRNLEGGARQPQPYLHREQAWGPAPAVPKADALVVRATNVGSATVDTRRARVSCAPRVELVSDGPLDLRLACPPVRSRRCARTLTLRVPRVRGARVTSVVVTRGGRTLRRVRGRDVRRVAVRRPTRRAFALRLRARTTRGRTITVLRRFGACT